MPYLLLWGVREINLVYPAYEKLDTITTLKSRIAELKKENKIYNADNIKILSITLSTMRERIEIKELKVEMIEKIYYEIEVNGK